MLATTTATWSTGAQPRQQTALDIVQAPPIRDIEAELTAMIAVQSAYLSAAVVTAAAVQFLCDLAPCRH
jgi:hypothetical protein